MKHWNENRWRCKRWYSYLPGSLLSCFFRLCPPMCFILELCLCYWKISFEIFKTGLLCGDYQTPVLCIKAIKLDSAAICKQYKAASPTVRSVNIGLSVNHMFESKGGTTYPLKRFSGRWMKFWFSARFEQGFVIFRCRKLLKLGSIWLKYNFRFP